MSKQKSVEAIIAPPPPHMVGDGFRVHNFFPGTKQIGKTRMSPFFMLDYGSKIEFSPKQEPRGVGVHPHAGFETVTIAYHGKVAHHDSAGNSGVIGEGDVQWMTAGSGLLHKEYHEKEFSAKGGLFQMVQLWVNLPAKDKKTKPKYQEITNAMNYIIEIATSDFLTTRSAAEGGADRIELCANLAEGGTTPSYAHIKKCREAFDIPLFPIIRPRGGDFLYNKDEFEIMKNDIKLCKELGCEGIVIGLLNMDGTIDITRTSELIELAYPLEITFHRAFDRCKDPFQALEELVEIGCQRILTSGQQSSVGSGQSAVNSTAVQLIAELNKAADDRIIIMPGSGVRKENIKMLAEKTGCIEFHSSLRGKTKSPMQFIHPAFANSEESYSNNAISPDDVRALRNALS